MKSLHAETATSAISLRGISHQFGAFTALQDVSFDIGRGEMFGLIGHNGAGKSTLFKLMLGLLTPVSGSIKVLGQDTGAAAFRQTRRQIGYLPENFVTYDNLSGTEVLQLFADLKQVPRSACADLLELVGLTLAAGRHVQTYSKGMRQRLGLAQALLGEPQLIFLDEPTNGLDPQGIADFYAILDSVRARGATIVITSHILAEIQERVDHLLIMHGGRVAAQGTLAQLRQGMALPLTVVATVAPLQQPQALAALAAVQASSREVLNVSTQAERLSVRCAAADKMAVLTALLPMASDVAVHESTLEQVFLGYGAAYAHVH
ncbi:ABC transporter ATP-binding protein [Duganella fentianensis]|uniref:ABC transporter ATP-binding protein n=1 Tax=Duganella fentianensis TaxID=2692177 RepID=UPI0032B21FC2